MNKFLACGLLLSAAGLTACAPAAVVVVSPDYASAHAQRVALAGFGDFPGAPGSGEATSSIFEKYLLQAGYGLVGHQQSAAVLQSTFDQPGAVSQEQLSAAGKALGVDALAFGTLTAFTNSSDQTVMVDMPQEQTDPVFGTVTTTQRGHGERVTSTQNVVTGYATTTTDQIVPETQTVPAHVAMSVQLLDAASGEMLWSVSSAADGDDLAAAAEAASAAAMKTVAARLKKIKGQ